MLIYLVQHGKAKTKEEDPERSLNNEGKKDIEKVAMFLKKINIKVDSIIHSEKLRAKESAEILLKGVNSKKGLKEVHELLPEDNIMPISLFINQEENDLMFVGHLPFMDKLSSLLLTGNEENKVVKFRQGAIICLEKDNELNKFKLKWMIPPEIIIPDIITPEIL